MITVLAATAVLLTPQTVPISDLYQKGFKDASFTLKVVKANQSELAKISKDFGASYRFSSTEVKVKEPFKLRMTANVEDTNVLFIMNGTRRLFSIPKARLNQKENLAEDPGKRQTLLDFGILTPALFDDLFVASFIRKDRATGDLVYDIKYHPRLSHKSYFRVWIDPDKKYITKKEWYRRDRQLATFFYTDAKLMDGVWIPTRMSVRNVEDKFAGETMIQNLKVNTGLSEELFKIS